MRILLLGKKGLLGSEFLQILENKKHDFLAPSHAKLDITDRKAVIDFAQKNGKFNYVICCVAYTAVDRAENDKEQCKKINVDSIKNLLELNSPIIHFSTDYVFNVAGKIEIEEDHRRSPLNFYGKTKLRAEKILENSGIDFWNIRTSGLFGKNKNNFFTNIYDFSQKLPELKIVDDQLLRPTLTSDLAEYVMKYFINKNQPKGHYHAQNSGKPASWADLARFYLDLKSINTPIKKISSEELGAIAKRPKNSVLKNTKIKENLRDWKKAIQKFVFP
jgi:dTDP-4-dehydrorhamnose reductase